VAADGGWHAPARDPLLLLSINRFERKKSIGLALEALARLRRSLPAATAARVRLVVAGGYDLRVAENVSHFRELHAQACGLGLSVAPASADEDAATAGARLLDAALAPGTGPQVVFLRSFTDAQKQALLRACSAVVYTPSNEHFGIVPIEAMAAYRPVVAVASGGPLESVEAGVTGLLCDPRPEAFAQALAVIATGGPDVVRTMGVAARQRVERLFSREAFGARLDAEVRALVGAAPRGRASDATARGAAAQSRRSRSLSGEAGSVAQFDAGRAPPRGASAWRAAAVVGAVVAVPLLACLVLVRLAMLLWTV
jgi:alpha-1,3/alpha-1,6-mannosyltransferase